MIEFEEAAGFMVGIITGFFVGMVFFGGLWWTVRRLPNEDHPVALYLGSLAVRHAVTLGGFLALLFLFGWPQLIAALLGFVTVRIVVVRYLKPPPSAKKSMQTVN